MHHFRDMLGRDVPLHNKPKRIVSLVPSQTELLADLGLVEEVVGITKFCVHPAHWFRSKARVGGTKKVSIEKVRALQPDLILANKEENVQEQIESLAKEFPVWVSDIQTLDEALTMIRSVGELCGRGIEGGAIADRISRDFSQLATVGPSPLVALPTAYCIWREPWMWAGGDTFISDVLHRAGFQNALQDFTRYPTLSLEEISALKPASVLLSSEPYPFKENHVEEVRAVLPGTTIKLVDGEMFSWYGSRLLKTPAYFASVLSELAL